MERIPIGIDIAAYPTIIKNKKEMLDWIEDPYMELQFLNAVTRKPIINRYSHVYFNRAEYKKIDFKNDLIFNAEMFMYFNSLMMETDVYDDLVDEVNSYRLEFNFDPVEFEMPCYIELPYITRRKSIMSIFMLSEEDS